MCLLVRVSHSLRACGFVGPAFTDILAHEPEEPLRRNLFNAGHPNKIIQSHLLKVEQGREPCKLEPRRELGKLMSPAAAEVIFIYASKPFT